MLPYFIPKYFCENCFDLFVFHCVCLQNGDKADFTESSPGTEGCRTFQCLVETFQKKEKDRGKKIKIILHIKHLLHTVCITRELQI